ncbi:MAG: hypothetical protein CM1200mP26_12370 [Acidimicrobiales bacterium]|nr:MAG: hypothetical protein CM1200mP26_12370 [Acidimicrobiales bacterium]
MFMETDTSGDSSPPDQLPGWRCHSAQCRGSPLDRPADPFLTGHIPRDTVPVSGIARAPGEASMAAEGTVDSALQGT